MKSHKMFGIAAIVIAFVIIVTFILIQPWQKKKMILSVDIPQSPYTMELWEKPYWYFGFGNEYETWVVINSPSEEDKWYLIDEAYITFRSVSLFISSDSNKIRIESTGETTPPHMIAEYDLKEKKLKAESEETVRDKEGWSILKEKTIRLK